MRASKGMQIKIYMGKHWRIFLNEHGWKTFISAAIIAGIVALVASDGMFEVNTSTSNGSFALVCACIWIGIFNSIQSVCKERDIIKREHRSGLHMSSYITSHILFDTILCAVEALIVAIILFVIKSDALPSEGAMLPAVAELYFTFFLIIVCSDALGLMISSIVKTPNTAMTVMPFVLIVQFIMSGKIFPLEDGFSSAIASLTIGKWGLNGLCITSDVNHLPHSEELAPYAANPQMEDLLEGIFKADSAYECAPGNLLGVWALLIGFTLLYCAIATFSLRFIDKDRR